MEAEQMYHRFAYIKIRILSMDTRPAGYPELIEAIRKLPIVTITGIKTYRKLFASPESTIATLGNSPDSRCEISEDLLDIFKGGNRTIENWLLEGPVVNILIRLTDFYWEGFKSSVDRYLLDPASRALLDSDLHVLFFGAETTVPRATNATIDQDPRELEEGRASNNDTSQVTRTNTGTQQPQSRWNTYQEFVHNSWKEARRLLGILLYIINIGAGLGYAMLTFSIYSSPSKGPKPVAVAVASFAIADDDQVASRIQL
jgi:hypothetical protein